MTHVRSGLELSWITTGGEVESFKVYRVNTDGTEEMVAQGPAASNRLMRVAAPEVGSPAARGVYVIAITGRTGWETRVSSDGKTERRPPLFSNALAQISPDGSR